MSATPKIKAEVLRNFKDAGAEKHFAKGAKPSLDAGVFANYLAAGLVKKSGAELEKAAA